MLINFVHINKTPNLQVMKKKSIIFIYSFLTMSVFFIFQSCSEDKNDDNNSSTVTDIDGNVYNTVKIGTQTWMVENLKTTRFNDGTAIPNVTDASAWNALITPGYCWYDNNEANKATYGALYNWYAVNTGKLPPAGWHVATDADWKNLEMALGMTQDQADATGNRGTDQGAQLKSTSGWSGGGNGTNSSGFSGFPNGYRVTVGFLGLGGMGIWWTSTERTSTGAWDRILYSYNTLVDRNDNSKACGFSVRCVKDN